ncbi:MAG: amidohydrolase family protein [Acidimicrobiales bacterium]|jgi:predicted TIM-barrel fold metal-dependent hydrolase
MPISSPATAVIDADGHVVEPPSAWESVSEEYRPVITLDSSGYEHVVVADKEILAVPLGTLATPGSSFSDTASFKPLGEAQAGGSDPELRLVDMDTEEIDQAVLFPSVGLYFAAIEDPKAAVALARAYNDWLAGYCKAAPTRLFGAAMLPLQDVDAAISELHRAVGDLGFPAAFVRPNPCNGRSLPDRAYDPLWSAIEEIGLPIGIHEGSSVIIPTLGSERPFNPLVLHAVSHSFEEMLSCAQMIAFGVLERHPKMNVVFLESSGGWVPFWMERLDEQAETFGGFCPEMKLKPSEYFSRQCFISYEVDEKTLPSLTPFIGEDRIVWGSDYPHHDATFPGAVDALRKTMSPLPPSAQSKIIGGNARRVYRLPSRYVGAAALVDDYFAAVTSRDPKWLKSLFATDAVVVSGEMRIDGVGSIVEFYRNGAFKFDDLRPRPGPLEVAGEKVEVDIDLRLGGTDSAVHDTFKIADGRIVHLDISTLPSVLS